MVAAVDGVLIEGFVVGVEMTTRPCEGEAVGVDALALAWAEGSAVGAVATVVASVVGVVATVGGVAAVGGCCNAFVVMGLSCPRPVDAGLTSV